MAAVTGLTVIKKFTYRGDPTEEWSNTYHFKSAPPGDDASWRVLANDVINREINCYPSSSKVVRVYGYNSNDEHAIAAFTWDLTLEGVEEPGVLPITGHRMAGDQAAIVWWRTNRKNTRGKWVYLRKYMHDGETDINFPDALQSSYLAALEAFAGGGPNGLMTVHGGPRSAAVDDTIQNTGAIPTVTTRTLKRRGKRPLVP